jgi:hypothetical protein
VKTYPRWVVACINWTHPDAPHAMSYLWDGDEMKGEAYHADWSEAMARVERMQARSRAA